MERVTLCTTELDVISVLFFCKKSLLARQAFALFERTTSNSASETLTWVKQSKNGDVCLLASERSERDTYRGNTIENRGC